jgi:hypothetical protein
MLEDSAVSQEEESIVSWLPHGKAFRVHKPKEFASFVMSRYFKQSQYKSFQRQLHIYGFRRITCKAMSDFGAYYHKSFIRDQKGMSLRMTRQTIKGPADDLRHHSCAHDKNPDFYQRSTRLHHGTKNQHVGDPPAQQHHRDESSHLVGESVTTSRRIVEVKEDEHLKSSPLVGEWWSHTPSCPTVLSRHIHVPHEGLGSMNAIFSSRRQRKRAVASNRRTDKETRFVSGDAGNCYQGMNESHGELTPQYVEPLPLEQCTDDHVDTMLLLLGDRRGSSCLKAFLVAAG